MIILFFVLLTLLHLGVRLSVILSYSCIMSYKKNSYSILPHYVHYVNIFYCINIFLMYYLYYYYNYCERLVPASHLLHWSTVYIPVGIMLFIPVQRTTRLVNNNTIGQHITDNTQGSIGHHIHTEQHTLTHIQPTHTHTDTHTLTHLHTQYTLHMNITHCHNILTLTHRALTSGTGHTHRHTHSLDR